MAARYRKVDVRLWNDRVFLSLSKAPPNAQSLWIFLLTGPHTTPLPGVFQLGEAALAEILGWDAESTRKLLREIETAKSDGLPMLRLDPAARLMWLPNALKHNPPENPNVAKGWGRVLLEMPECALRDEIEGSILVFLNSLGEKAETCIFGFKEGMGYPTNNGSTKGLPNGSTKGLPNQKHEQEQKNEHEHEKEKANPSISPTPFNEIVKAYHEICESFPTVRELSEKRKANVRSAWKRHPDLAYWKSVFEKAQTSAGMIGQQWANFDFMFQRDVEIFEGKYEKEFQSGTSAKPNRPTFDSPPVKLQYTIGGKKDG